VSSVDIDHEDVVRAGVPSVELGVTLTKQDLFADTIIVIEPV
jgi:hypothetical protein